MPSRGTTPLRAEEVGLVEGEGLAALAGGFPAETLLGETALARLAREVEVDVVEGLPGFAISFCSCGV